jgi:hypothetical protein
MQHTKAKLGEVLKKNWKNKAMHGQYIWNIATNGKCRLCQQCDETIDHIISACPILAKEQYVK